ncbi:hypothetical protein BLA39750_03103 [Burkholderia lata]|uniref:Uncharacterized protein n=1 Tax=Burkholderia lata (strain ATCC 17760 / DSM 23089 / LMG 22485 / NCIMB 9086 / R18194 / 383) TaxID=482957 RepID=A0A6P2XHS4_BURL3|nr:hypothetical protein BLA39750_03103 [Burkholderia lata]
MEDGRWPSGKSSDATSLWNDQVCDRGHHQRDRAGHDRQPPVCRVRSVVRAAGRFLNSLPVQRHAGKKNPDTVIGRRDRTAQQSMRARGSRHITSMQDCCALSVRAKPLSHSAIRAVKGCHKRKKPAHAEREQATNGSAFEARGLSMADNGTGRANLSPERKLRNATSTGYGHTISRRRCLDENRRHSDDILWHPTLAFRQSFAVRPGLRSTPPLNRPRMANFGSEATQRALFTAGESCTS